MFTHPWKADDLTVATWYEPEKMYCNWDEADDDYFQSMIDNDEFCECCGMLGACPCSDWDDDCFVGKARPWDRGGWYADLVKLTAKGKRLRAECRAEMRTGAKPRAPIFHAHPIFALPSKYRPT